MAQNTKSSETKSLAAVVSHPLRTRIWVALTEEPASPNELAAKLRAPLGNIAYHVRVLERVGVIELAKTEPRRGAIEHWFRSVERPSLSTAETEERSLAERTDFATFICQLAFADAALALEAGTFVERPDHAISRIPVIVDEEGWGELAPLYEEIVERTLDVQAVSAERMARGGAGAPIRVTALASFFEMPKPE